MAGYTSPQESKSKTDFPNQNISKRFNKPKRKRITRLLTDQPINHPHIAEKEHESAISIGE